MATKIYEVTEVTTIIEKTNPPTLVVNAKGIIRDSGWKNGHLEPYIYIQPPEDGMYEFDFVADPPDEINTEVLTEIKAEPYFWNDYPVDIKGVRVYAEQNNLESFVSPFVE